MKRGPQDKQIKAKVVAGFALAGLAVAIALLITYRSFSHLERSVSDLSKPETRLTTLNQIRADVTRSENMIREYILERDDSLYQAYEKTVARTFQKIDSLKQHPANTDIEKVKIDSLGQLLEEETASFKRFIRSRDYGKNRDGLSLVVKEIEAQKGQAKIETKELREAKSDSLEALEEEKEEEVQPVVYITPTLSQIYQTYENQALRLLKQVEATEEVETQEAGLEYESLEQILTDAQKKEESYQAYMIRRELELLRKNADLLNRMQLIIYQLQADARAEADKNAQNARSVIRSSNRTLAIVTFIALITISIFISLIFGDITKSKFYRQQLIDAKLRAERLQKAKEEFLANMSHEIRTPLNAIQGFAEQLSFTPLAEKQQEYIKAVTSSSEHLLATVNDILDMSKIEAGKLKIERTPFQLREVVSDVCKAMQIRAGEKGIDLKCFLEEHLHVWLIGDAFRLRQVLFNLVHNAVKFTDEGFVEIECDVVSETEDKMEIVFRVNDTGIGIAPEKQEEIFQDFTQVDSSTTRKYGGTGLGLTICRKLIEIQNGSITLDSSPGEGTTFTVQLPFPKAGPQETAQEQQKLSIRGELLKDLKVLVADDDPLNNRLTNIILDKWGVKADFADNGRQALVMFKKTNYQLVMTDMHMPEMSGTDLTKAIRALENKKKAAVPVVAFTANVMKDDLKAFKEAGINSFLLKPFKEEEMYRKIAETCGLIDLAENGEVHSEKENIEKSIKNIDTENNLPLFSLDRMKDFVGDDPEELAEILQILLENNERDLEGMEKALQHDDWNEMGELAHKMLHSYQNLEVKSLIPLFKELEMLRLGKKVEDVAGKLNRISTVTGLIRKDIEIEIADLKKLVN